ncbi:phage tail sheath family protein [Streptomyces sp. NPDC002209]|uniref:phage tail sheath family protein n=1 Tax=Streptomyces sp. NPDC002209 TaxID=3364638 RepID=UPI003696D76D
MSDGVYVKDLPSGVRMIVGAGTSTAAFIAPVTEGSGKPVPFHGWSEFTEAYGVGSGRELAGANLVEAVYGFFANGGTKCYVVGMSGEEPAAYTAALAVLEQVADVHSVVVPDLWSSEADAPAIAKAVAGHCAGAGNRVAILHTRQEASVEDALKTPGLFGLDETEETFTTVYYPWLKVPGTGGTARVVPPSGHVAGIWARTDIERGVFKAPANQSIRGADGLRTLVNDAEHGKANEAGVNCLRLFPGRGLLVWGARTLSTSRDWKYLNVRRLVSFLSDSIQASSSWSAFEPSDERLWAALRLSVASFLTDQWRQGALLGGKEDEAFSVICDGTNNTPDMIKEGQVVIDIGIAPIRPAEFIHFRTVHRATAK